jgi:hypothetical protein
VQFGWNLARSDASRSPSVDKGVEGGRKWGKRHGALAWTRRKRAKRGTASGDAFCGGSAVRAERKRARGPARCRVGVGEGEERGGRGPTSWPSTTRTRRLRATTTAAGMSASGQRRGAGEMKESGKHGSSH